MPDKPKTVTLTAVRNIPLAMCTDTVPDHLRKHPGGTRVERGMTVTVTEDRAKVLKDVGYAK